MQSSDYRLILHDLDQSIEAFSPLPAGTVEMAGMPAVKYCIGCFGCWIKTPGRCVLPDRGAQMPALIASSRQLVVISRLVYGGFSPMVKALMDRSIGYAMPYFRFINGEMHHTLRYNKEYDLTVHFYGQRITPQEEEIAHRLVGANALNLGAASHNAFFHPTAEDALKEAL